MKRYRLAITALALGLVTLFFLLIGITSPPTPFYDEGQYIFSSRALLAGADNLNPEAPPLGKLLIAVGIKSLGDNALGWRVPGAICGALTLVAVFLWAYLLWRDYRLALTAAGFTLLNNFLFVMSRVAMMDAFLVLFLFCGLLTFTAALELDDVSSTKRRLLLCFAGVMFGFACACKWNGIDTLGIVIALSAALLWLGKLSPNERIAGYAKNLQQVGLVSLFICLIIVPVLAYAITYWPLCRSLHKPFGIRELVEMNRYIWRFHVAIESNRAIADAWYTWPFKITPQRGLSYLVGNFVVMWGGLLALAFCARRLWKSFPECLLVLLYTGNLLQWAVTPTKHLFYYYYYPAAMFLGVALAAALKDLPLRIFGVRLHLALLLAAAIFFVYCYPKMAHLASPWDCVFGCWN